MRLRKFEYRLLSAFAPALINGDYEGLNADETTKLSAFLTTNKLDCLDCNSPEEFSKCEITGLAGNTMLFVFTKWKIKPKTLVKFLWDKDGEHIYAYFPQLNYNKELYGTTKKMCYSRSEGHSSCHVDYAKECKTVKIEDYKNLKEYLEKTVGYTLKVLNK